MIAISGPTASRIAATDAMPVSTASAISASGEPGGGKPSQGAALIARNPSATARLAAAAKPAGVRGFRRAIDVRVDGQRVADLATQEDVGRHIECLAREIPERLFDRAERGGRNESLARHRLAALSIGFDLEWRTAVDQIEERRQLRPHARGIVCGRVREAEGIRCFAKPDKTGVRPETHDQPDRS